MQVKYDFRNENLHAYSQVFKRLKLKDTMQYISPHSPELIRSGGGRVSSPKLRDSIQSCEDFTGLEEGVNRYDLLLLVKRAGKVSGFSSKMIQLLDYYMAFTRDMDWEEGSRPIVYQSLSRTALDLGVSERQIQRLEQSLFEVGALSWNDSGNHRRYGQRCTDTGRILYAFGVDLTPLAYLRAALKAKLEEKQLYDRAWMETKRQISWYRRQIRSTLLEAEEGDLLSDTDLTSFDRDYDAIAMQIRTHMDLQTLRSLLEDHKELHSRIISDLDKQVTTKAAIDGDNNHAALNASQITNKESCANDQNDAHYKYTNQKQSNKLDTCREQSQCFQKSVAESSSDDLRVSEGGGDREVLKQAKVHQPEKKDAVSQTGLQHVSLKQLLNISSDRLKEHLPIESRPMNHNDFIEAAFKLTSKLGISQSSWGHGCLTLGRIGAAVCVILTDQANLREENRVMKPGAYFNAMINRAKVGELKLQQSVMGILKREFSNDDETVDNETNKNA